MRQALHVFLTPPVDEVVTWLMKKTTMTVQVLTWEVVVCSGQLAAHHHGVLLVPAARDKLPQPLPIIGAP